MPWPVELLDVPTIVAALGPAPAAPVHLYWELDSTQDQLARLLPGAPDLTVVLAERQALGRRARHRAGYRRRAWASPCRA